MDRKITIDDLQNKSIEEIVELYRQGYILDESTNILYDNSNSTNTLQTYPVDITCPYTDRQVNEGSTYTALWGYVYKVQALDTGIRQADVRLLLNGTQVDSKIMNIGDGFPVANPANAVQKQAIVAKNIFLGAEVKVLIVDYCQWTQQQAVHTKINFPPSVVDGTQYTLIGRFTKNISGSPIIGKKVYVTENGTRIREAITDSDGKYSVTYTHYYGFAYAIEMPLSFDYDGIIDLFVPFVVANATHIFRFKYATAMPDILAIGFRNISDPSIEILSYVTNLADISGWTVLKITMSSNQVSMYMQKTGSTNPILAGTVLMLALIAMLIIKVGGTQRNYAAYALLAISAAYLAWYTLDVLCATIIPGVCDYIGQLLDTKKVDPKNADVDCYILSPPKVTISGGGGSGASAVAKTTNGVVTSIDIIDGGSNFTSAPTISITSGKGTGAAANATITGDKVTTITVTTGGSGYCDYQDSLIAKLDEDCKKTYDACDKSTPDKAKICCSDYLNCLLNNGYLMIGGGKVALFPNARIELRALAEQLKTTVTNECISKFIAGTMTCDVAIACVLNRVRDGLASSSGIVNQYYPPGDKYVAPWAQPGGGKTGFNFGGLLLIGGLIVVGYVGYKYFTRQKAAEIRIRS